MLYALGDAEISLPTLSMLKPIKTDSAGGK